MGTAALDVQHLRKRIEPVVRNILISDSRQSKRIPYRVVERDPDLLQRILQEARIEHRVVCDKRHVTDKCRNLAGKACEIFRTRDILVRNSRKALDERAQFRRLGAHQVIHAIDGSPVLKTDKRHLDNFVLLEFKTGGFQVNRNKRRYLIHHLSLLN